MQTDEIQQYVSATKAVVCASDELPQHRIKSGLFISNTDEMNKSGAHWVLLAVVNTPERRIIYFDSLAVPPLIKYFYTFLKCNVEGGTLELNKNVIQAQSSQHCGRFCTLLAWHLFRGGKFDEFCKLYNQTPYLNDKKLEGRWALFMDWYKGTSASKKR